MSKGIAVALGMFDSVHIGHEAVISGVLNSPYRSTVITFDKLPNKTGGIVLSNEEKIKKLLATGVDTVEIMNFDEVKEMTPSEFLDMLTSEGFVKRIACGFNFRFGKNAEGDTDFIRQYCEKKGIEFFLAFKVRVLCRIFLRLVVFLIRTGGGLHNLRAGLGRIIHRGLLLRLPEQKEVAQQKG